MNKALNDKVITAQLFEKMIYGGVENLQNNLQIVNDLNVFPVPDGDTGENMFSTLKSGFDQLRKCGDNDISAKANAMANGMLLGARGNSGVILSQLFYGLAKGLEGKDEVGLADFSNALSMGVKFAYEAVSNPVEGTILTVAREAVENTQKQANAQLQVEEFFNIYLSEMKKSLNRTPDLLAVLKEAGVIDSGGAGLVYIIEGFCHAISGKVMDEIAITEVNGAKTAQNQGDFDENSEMLFGYCTELLLQLQNRKCDIKNFSLEQFKKYLNSIGDSVVAFQTGTIVKIHVHTLSPHLVLGHALNFGEFLSVKVENMTLQHSEIIPTKKQTEQAKRKKYALVTVASGEGLIKLFEQLGADFVINGGQTNNPSSQDFIQAFNAVNAENIFVLPNNGNIILTAKQASAMYDKSNVIVIESKNEGEGYSALSMLDYSSDDINKITEQLNNDATDVKTGMVARAVRNATLNGVTVQANQYMGYTDKKLLVARQTKIDAVCALLDEMDKSNRYCLVTVYGKSVTFEEKNILRAFVKENYNDLEFYEIEGMQEVYDFLLFLQ